MIVLYNGEYQEYDITQTMNYKQILDGIEYRKPYLGQKCGDFEIVLVDYDFATRHQVNIGRCINCGAEKEIPNIPAFKRGKGVGQLCKCRRKKKEKKNSIPKNEIYSSHVGETMNGFNLTDYVIGRGFRTECIECGKQKWVSGNRILDGIEKCNHKIKTDYSDPKWIGEKIGSLTAIGREGGKIRFRCDCGKEIIRHPGGVFSEKGIRSCGRTECAYHKATIYNGKDKRLRGLKFEAECAAEMERQGYAVEMTPGTGDYGVDFFAVIDGEKVAFQCKRLKVESMVGAVQEVYAGGRYYDVCKFVVVSPSGFTYPAELMAQKLGVQLEKNLENFELKSLNENKIDTQRITAYSGHKLMWEIDGVSKPVEEWCREYKISRTAVINRVKKKGMSLKEALMKPKYEGKNIIEINGVTKSKQEWCDEYGISPQLYDYRVKYSKLSPLEALTREKVV